MSRFRQIVRGIAARHKVELPLPGGGSDVVAVRPLNDIDDSRIDDAALEYAKEHGVSEDHAKPGNGIYDRAHALHTLLIACSDPDSPDEAPVPYFESIAEIQAGLDRDRIAILLAAQQIHQERCSPRALTMSGDDVFVTMFELATSEDERPFVRLQPGMQWILLRTLAALVLNSQELKSAFTSEVSVGFAGVTRKMDS